MEKIDETNGKRHVALPLKYRPMTFDDVVGQEHVVRTLRNALASNRIANAYLFVGPRGIGKTTLSRIFAKALNCSTPNGVEPCGTCDNCRQIAVGAAIDVLELDAASHNKVEDVKPIIEAVQFKPAASKYKIFIVDECHMLTTAAWNALLKTLEEPPPYVKFIFATTEGDKVLATIVSRCQRFDLHRIRTDQIVSRLRHVCTLENVDASPDALLALARGAEGGMRDALSSLDQLIAFKSGRIEEDDALGVFGLVSRQALEGLARAILTGDAAAILASVATFDSAGKNMRRLAAELMEHFRNLVVCRSLGGVVDGLEATDDQKKTLVEQSKLVDVSRLYRITDLLAEMEDKLRYVLSVRTFLELSLLRASRIATVATIDELLRAVRQLAAGVPVATPVPQLQSPRSGGTPLPQVVTPPQSPTPDVQSPKSDVQSPKSDVQSPKPDVQSPKPDVQSPKSDVQSPKPQLSRAERQAHADDPALQVLMSQVPGSSIIDIK